MSEPVERDGVWARAELLLRADEPPVIRGWEAPGADPALQFGDLAQTEDWNERTATVEVGDLRVLGSGGARWQPWLVRAFLEAAVDGAWLAMGDPDRDVLTGQDPILGTGDALTLIKRARFLRMLDSSVPSPPPVVRSWHHWAAISEQGQLSVSEMFDLLPGPIPTGRRGDALPEGLAAHIRTAYLIFVELSADLRAERLPEAIRRPADAYGGFTVLEMIRTGRTTELLEDIRDGVGYAGGS